MFDLQETAVVGQMEFDPFIKRIKKRIYKEDKDAIIIMAGERGSTKSGCAISLGDKLDRDEKGETRFRLPEKYFPKGFKLRPNEQMPRLVFKPSDFLRILSEDDLPMGSVIIWDETGIEADARDFQSKKNKLLKRTMETIRSLNLILFLTAPTLFSFDISLRRSATYYIECQGAFGTPNGERFGHTRIYEIQTNPKTGKTYFKVFRFAEAETERTIRMDRYDIPKPLYRIEKPYKRYKRLFQTTLYEDYYKELTSIDNLIGGGPENKSEDLDVLAEKVLASPLDFFDSKKNKFLVAALRAKLKINRTEAYDLKQLLEFRRDRGEISV